MTNYAIMRHSFSSQLTDAHKWQPKSHTIVSQNTELGCADYPRHSLIFQEQSAHSCKK